MVIVALILGILGGAAGLAIALGVDVTPAGASLALPSSSELMTLKMMTRVAGPIVTVLGGIVAIPKHIVGGVLMLIGAAGMVATFELNSLTAIAIVLSVAGAVLAVYACARSAPARA